MGLNSITVPVAAAAAAVGLAAPLLWFLSLRFSVRVPPNRAAVLFGRRGTHRADDPTPGAGAEITDPKIVVGGRAFVAPWSRGVAYLSLAPVGVEVTVRSLDTLAGTRAAGWEVRVAAQAKIPVDAASLRTAAENLLGKSEEEVRTLVRHEIEAAVPAVLSRLRPGEVSPDWDQVASEVQAAVAPNLLAFGLVIRSLSVASLLRIVPAETPGSLNAVRPGAPHPAERSEAVSAALELRLSRVERSLGIIGAEIVRVVREGSARDGAPSFSVLDVPLGFESPDEVADATVVEAASYDSIGGSRMPRARRPSLDGPARAVGGPGSPLLDAEMER